MRTPAAHVALAVLAVLYGPHALAQYKIVDADGRVTYTDRPTTGAGQKMIPLSRASAAAAEPTSPLLPLELRPVAARFPVVLYAASDCPPCDAARQLLVQRGIPFNERRITTEDDAAALQRALGWRTVPSITIGTQALRGLSVAEWQAYLDAAGYPRESRLPRDWQPPKAAPLVERAPLPTAAAPETVTAAPPATPTPVEPAPDAEPRPSIKF